ncbi:hypothetical protein Pcinc_020238 [Petrolisthes cinctipes]|uniref:Probable RNA-binding protein EIF1AD n=1 Tax=Petrolisthes cinctipes TaxID=88211 RepID=A0AAE1FJR1_PETCI|nr:hypothetical protein Pcinc_020238 [Petrolisthes cinctipes]
MKDPILQSRSIFQDLICKRSVGKMSATTKKKHVEREMYEDFTLPEEHQTIVRVVRPRGNNLHQVITAEGEEFLASMPLKFRKHVWIKRGDYVVTEPIPEGNKVKAEIVRILMKDHIRHLTQCNMWPDAFTQQLDDRKDTRSDSLAEAKLEDSAEYDSESSENSDLLEENPNRQRVYIEDSSDSSETESDDDFSHEEND